MGSDGREHSLQSTDSMEEVRHGETRSGRVSSSTGNIANAACEGMKHSSSLEQSSSTGLLTEDHRSSRMNSSEGNLERMQSAGSICHPSTTTRFCESTETDSNPAHLSHENSLENQNDVEQYPDEVISDTPEPHPPGSSQRNVSIKTEPVSPVRSLAVGPVGNSRSFSEDGDGRKSGEDAPDDPDEIQIVEQDSPEVSGSTTEETDEKAEEPSSIRHPSRQNSLTPSESGGRGILRRQATVDLPDCENEPGETRNSGSEVVAQQQSPRFYARNHNDVIPSEKGDERSTQRDSSEIDHHQRGDHSIEVRNNSAQLSPVPQVDSYPSSHSTLRDLVSRGQRQYESREGGSQASAHERYANEVSRSVELNPEPQPLARGTRVRSHSISEGENIPDQESRPQTKDYHQQLLPTVSSAPRVPSIQVSQHLPVPSYWPGYHGLVYQPRSWDGDHSSMYRHLAPPGHPHHPDYRGPVRSRSEEVPSSVPSGVPCSAEGSVLYKYLQKNGTTKPKRNRGTFQGSHSAEGDSSHPGYYMPPMNDLTRRGLHHPMMIPWPTSSSLSSHPSFSMYQEPNASPTSQPAGSGQASPEGYRFHRSMELRTGESSQDLAHVDDITRQVQQAVGGAASLYGSTEHPLVTLNDMGESSQNCSRDEDEVGSKDGDNIEVKKRSRKSTFNIYREIPERKRKLDRDEEERIKHSYNADGSFDYFSLTGWKAYKCRLCKKRRFKTASELEEHMRRKHPNEKGLLCSQSPVPVCLGSSPNVAQDRAFSPANG